MPEPKRTILIIENQKSQQEEISGCLKSSYKVYPNYDDYIRFIDNVRVWVNEEYKPEYREKALGYINQIINDNDLKIELIIMDHKLGGAHKCKNGIDLATELNNPRKTTNSVLPVIFISKTEHTDKRIIQFDNYQIEYPKSSDWVHKGYFGDEILEPAFIKQNVVTKIEKLLGESLKIRLIEKLKEKTPKITAATFETERDIASKTDTLITAITDGKVEATNKLLLELTERSDETDYLELLESTLMSK